MKGESTFQVVPGSRQRGGIYTKGLNLSCFVLLLPLWEWRKGLREFVAKKRKFRDSFHFKVEMLKHCQLIPLRRFQRICQLRIVKICLLKCHLFTQIFNVYQGTISRTLWSFLAGPSVSTATLTSCKLGEMKRSEILLTLFILSLHVHPVARTLSDIWRKDPEGRLELGQRGVFLVWKFVNFISHSVYSGIQQFCYLQLKTNVFVWCYEKLMFISNFQCSKISKISLM